MSTNLPGAQDVQELWKNLCAGKESITFFSEEELDNTIDRKVIEKGNYIKARGILKDFDKFDAEFFRISPREAEMMDPQHRLFLENAWSALENAGYDPERYDGLIGVYGGAWRNTYYENHVAVHPEMINEFGENQTYIGNGPDYITTRVSYKLNLKGPSINISTACSTSLVAVCMACDALLNFQCDLALAGGVYMQCPPNSGYLYEPEGMFSADGHTRPFDENARGTVFGDGVGIVTLKRLQEAIKDRDFIYAIIRGTAINNDGSGRMSFTAPSVNGQAEVIAMAHANSGVEAKYITYVEAHGTATPIGDPIELEALTKAFRLNTDKKRFCAIGSIKGNIGHVDAAAGVAGLIKTALALHHKMIPPSINYKKPNPEIDFENSPFYVNTELTQWDNGNQPRQAGVSSFGVGGTNAHVVLEEAPQKRPVIPTERWHLLPISAKNEHALESATKRLVEFLESNPDIDIESAVHTLQHGRREFNYRRIAACRDVADAKKILAELSPQRVVTANSTPRERDIVFMFSGQSSQYVRMGRDLYQIKRIFKEQVDICSELLKSSLRMDLRNILYPDDNRLEEASSLINETYLTQPALFTIEYALAKLLEDMGIAPSALVGHSIGEYVAACLSGVFTLEDALHLVALRGRLIQSCPKGAMLGIFLPVDKIHPYLKNGLSLAAVNAPQVCVVSGEIDQIAELENHLTENNIAHRRLHTSHAFHSTMMDSIKDKFVGEVQQITLNEPSIPYLSNVTGTWILPNEATDPNYWGAHLRKTVLFSECSKELLKDDNRVLLEVGPGNILCSLALQHTTATAKPVIVSSLRHVREKIDDEVFLLKAFGHLWTSGKSINWRKLSSNHSYRIPLPHYPFNKKRHWIVPQKKHHQDLSLQALDENYDSERAVAEDDTQVEVFGVQRYVQSNEIELKVAEIWKKVLGYRNISLDDNYFELGGSSLMAVRVFDQIEKLLGKRLPLATLYEAPTVKKLADILCDNSWVASWSPLVNLRSGDSKPPFFFIHAAGGNVLLYRDLARHLPDDQPISGLQSRGMDGERSFDRSIEEMASHYVEEILKVYPDGPFMFGGYCMGGTIALEIAQQLTAQGKTVDLLVFFETYNWGNIEKKTLFETLHFYWQKIDFHLRNLFIAENRLAFLYEKVKVADSRKKIYYEMAVSKFNQRMVSKNGNKNSLSQIWTINDEAAMKYKPKRYNGRIITFLPLKQYSRFVKPEAGWQDLAAGGVEEHVLPVYPAGMLVEPFVKNLATELSKCIERATATEN